MGFRKRLHIADTRQQAFVGLQIAMAIRLDHRPDTCDFEADDPREKAHSVNEIVYLRHEIAEQGPDSREAGETCVSHIVQSREPLAIHVYRHLEYLRRPLEVFSDLQQSTPANEISGPLFKHSVHRKMQWSGLPRK